MINSYSQTEGQTEKQKEVRLKDSQKGRHINNKLREIKEEESLPPLYIIIKTKWAISFNWGKIHAVAPE